jgi:CheY-like chemotaxis protein
MQPDEAFEEQVRDFLTNLYDYSYLQTSPLIGQLAPTEDIASLQAMRNVRSLVLKTLEHMNPGANVSFRSPRARAHNILKLHYVEGLTVMEVAHELAISERTLYRELRKAEQDLAVLLGAFRRPEIAPKKEVGETLPEELVLQEAQRIGSEQTDIQLALLLQGVLVAVDRLSQRRQVQVTTTPVEESCCVQADPLLARQVLISTLSHVIQNSQPETAILVQADAKNGKARFRVDYRPGPGVKTGSLFPSAAQQLVRSLGGEWAANMGSDGQASITFAFGGEPQSTILVIDDNESLVELFRRYLADENYQLIGARDGQEGLRLAEQSAPDVVILDVMMSQNDGWEVLQWFQTQVNTRHIPVIVCSVLSDPELAFSLGAADFLVKPVDRATLLKTLSRHRSHTQPLTDPASPAST